MFVNRFLAEKSIVAFIRRYQSDGDWSLIVVYGCMVQIDNATGVVQADIPQYGKHFMILILMPFHYNCMQKIVLMFVRTFGIF